MYPRRALFSGTIASNILFGNSGGSEEEMKEAAEIAQAQAALAEAGRQVVFLASICGSYDDFQDYLSQKAKLEAAGAVVTESNAQAVELAILTVGPKRQTERWEHVNGA